MKFLLLTILMISSSIVLGQSSIEIEKYLTTNWVSAASIVNGDTTAMNSEDEKLFLQTNNNFRMIAQGKDIKGEWKYLPENDLLMLNIKSINDEPIGKQLTMKTELEILQREENILTLSKKGGRTIIYIMEGTETKIPNSH